MERPDINQDTVQQNLGLEKALENMLDYSESLVVNTAGPVYYVSRNVQATGDGLSWDTAFKTIGEGIAKLNANYTLGTSLYPSKGRNSILYIGEGWYAETPLTLTASDCTIIVTAPGNHDSTVLYGVPVAGTFSGVAGGPALKVTGSNNTIYNLGAYTSDPLYAAFQNGAPSVGVYGNKFVNCSAVRDVADGELGGILDYGADGTKIINFFASTSCKDYGIRSYTNGVINPVNLEILGGRFIGTETGILIASGHNAVIKEATFLDDTSDRADTITLPINAAGSTNTSVIGCWSEFSNANIVTGGTSTLAIDNKLLATPA